VTPEQRLTDAELDQQLADRQRAYYDDDVLVLALPTPWRPLTTLPPAGMFCLVTTQDAIVQSATFAAFTGEWYSDRNCPIDDVIAWMPLPPPYLPETPHKDPCPHDH
jgi:hypothetical protein